MLPIVPMFHANAWGLPYGALMAGADLVLPDRFLDGTSLIDLIETQRPTIAGAVPTIWNDVLHCLETAPGHDISSLRLVACGGSAVPVSLMKAFEEKFGVADSAAWGMTETSPVATVAWPPPGYRRTTSTGRCGPPQGRPMCGVEVRIVDDAGDPLPNDGKAVGELEVRGPWITGSLLPRAATTAKFDSGWLRTGDVGRIDPLGYVTLTDRAKDVIKSGGEWISSVELENHLIAHPGGAGGRRRRRARRALAGAPAGRRRARGGAPRPARQELREFLADKVVRWWLPERWTFVDAGAAHQRRQVRQEDDPRAARRRRVRGDRGVTGARASGVPAVGGYEMPASSTTERQLPPNVTLCTAICCRSVVARRRAVVSRLA